MYLPVVSGDLSSSAQVPERVRKSAEKKANKVKLVQPAVIKDSFGTIRLALRR